MIYKIDHFYIENKNIYKDLHTWYFDILLYIRVLNTL